MSGGTEAASQCVQASPAPNASTLQTAKDYTARGWRVIPLLHRDKNPKNSVGSGWPDLRLDDADLPDHFNCRPANIGVLLGEPSGGLVDVDLDHEVAVYFADRFLPPTGAIFGHDGKRRSHWLYRVADPPNTRRWHDKTLGTIVELRGTGGQTVFPGSTHPDGDPITWDEEGEPALADLDELRQGCQRLHDFVVYSVKVTNYALNALERACEQVRTAPAPTGTTSGNRNNELFQQAIGMGQLVAASALRQEHVEKELLLAALAAGLKEHEVVGTLSQGLSRGLKEPRDLSHVAARPEFMEPICAATTPSALTAPGEGATQPNCVPGGPPRRQEAPPYRPRTVTELLEAYPKLRPAVIEGLLRRGETANIIAAPKVGKSWAMLDLLFAVATGGKWLGRFQCTKGRVLLVDNELHCETLAGRIRRLLVGRQMDVAQFGDAIHVDSLRGRLVDLYAMRDYFGRIEPGYYDLIVLDAYYRFLPRGADENSNGDVASLYNLLDQFAAQLECGFALVHHSTKGSQTGKSVTDVGAGAGSQSRAADTHLVLRAHEEANAVVCDAAVRSWPPITPFCLRLDFPVWSPADDLDPTALRPERPARPRRLSAKDDPFAEESQPWDTERFVAKFLSPEPILLAKLMDLVDGTKGLSGRKADDLLKRAVDQKLAYRWISPRKNEAQRIATVPQPAPAAVEVQNG